ncbi:uncharacterized protein BDZ99DRAFT_200396 [Mytilinidion resinicola]|uniref:Uncharacterized protein n=1 Tax=Mytilinidion resinicola TaxID=574789 RepID=A0A6A6Y3L9_9PEZI|nr:uncharacterized protein BDZ99DRAFT_200396 [Mytilinidion resinicola]KAF2802825.1 hypothetical protein BDZ99DRAFT_200396 [Mytilinidion resinicola]
MRDTTMDKAFWMNSMSETDTKIFKDKIQNPQVRHQECWRDASKDLGLDNPLFHACRQTYEETQSLPYKSYTFSFRLATSLERWLTELSSWQRMDIRKLHMEWAAEHAENYSTGTYDWDRVGSSQVTECLSRCTTLHLSLELHAFLPGTVSPEHFDNLFKLRALALKEVTIIIKPIFRPKYYALRDTRDGTRWQSCSQPELIMDLFSNRMVPISKYQRLALLDIALLDEDREQLMTLHDTQFLIEIVRASDNVIEHLGVQGMKDLATLMSKNLLSNW